MKIEKLRVNLIRFLMVFFYLLPLIIGNVYYVQAISQQVVSPDNLVTLDADGNVVLSGNFTGNFTGNSAIVQSASFIIDKDGTNYHSYHGANSTQAETSTNASAVINNAIGNLTSGSIHIKSGTYILPSGLTIDAKAVSLFGDGPGATLLMGTSTDVVLTIKNSPAFPSEHLSPVIRDLSIMGAPTLAAASRVASKAVLLENAVFVTFSNVWMGWSNGSGLTIHDSLKNNFFDCKIAYNNGTGLDVLYTSTISTYQRFYGCEFRGNANMSMILTSWATCFEFYGCIFESNEGTYQTYLYSAYESLFDGCHFETGSLGNTAHVGITGATTHSVFRKCFFSAGTLAEADVTLASVADDTVFHDCDFTVNRENIDFNGDASKTTFLYSNIFAGTIDYHQGILVAEDNVGFVTENSGSWSGTNPVTVAHGLAGTPTIVNIGVNAAQPYATSWTADATNIVIYHNGAGSLSGSWSCEYKP